MSAHMIQDYGNIGCAECGSHYDYLDFKSGNDDDVWYCRCLKCGFEDFYVFPKSCMYCDFDDWTAYYSGMQYEDECPNCREDW